MEQENTGTRMRGDEDRGNTEKEEGEEQGGHRKGGKEETRSEERQKRTRGRTGGKSRREEARMRMLVLCSKSSRVYPVRKDTGQAKPLREARKYGEGANAAKTLRSLRRCG
ncbi:MAG: hypothetical protein K2P88_01760 [Chitinophagaceae bacterium]|nr:hypothetical protein [Chitinophagaceae bacterium]